MGNALYKAYFRHILEIVARVESEQSGGIESTALVIADAIQSGRSVFAFGCSHAGILVEELFYRAGGLAVINPIFNPTLMLNTRPVTMTSRMERLEGFGKEIVASSRVSSGDVLLIHSVSGRNPGAVDAALAAKERGAYVVALTNVTYSARVSSRHSGGKKLYEIADLVLDNCGDFGDASVPVPGSEQKMAPTSTVIGALILNAVVVHTVSILAERGSPLPVFRSANVDGGDEENERIMERFKNQIHYL